MKALRTERLHRFCGVVLLVCGLGALGPVLGHAQGPAKAALYDGAGSGDRSLDALERQLVQAGLKVERLGVGDIEAGRLSSFTVVVFGSGSGSEQGLALGKQGRQQVRKFVEGGGGYVGIGAGAYLATTGYTWSLKILDGQTISPLWRRGTGTVKIELTERGRELLGGKPGSIDVQYTSGPVIAAAAEPDLPDYEVLAHFRSEMAENDTPQGIMIGAPAIAVGRFGQGRVAWFSAGSEKFLAPALKWVAASDR